MTIESIPWLGRGEAKRLLPRGMSDYTRGVGPSDNTYQTDDGATLTQRVKGWKAQYRGHTTKWKPTAEEAIAALEGMIPCPHAQRTVPSDIHIKAEGSQEIIGTATLRVCIECGHVEGHVTNASLFNPTPPTPFTVEPNGDIGVEARKALGVRTTYRSLHSRCVECRQLMFVAQDEPDIVYCDCSDCRPPT